MRQRTLWKYYLPLLLACLIQPACDDSPKRPAHIQIPDGYIGWVRIELGVPNTPKLQTDGNWEIQRVPPSGLLQTASEPLDMNAVAPVDYSYYSGDKLKVLPDGFISVGVVGGCFKKSNGERFKQKFVTFFVGPKADYEKRKQELDQYRRGDCEYVVNNLDDLPKVGNVASAAR